MEAAVTIMGAIFDEDAFATSVGVVEPPVGAIFVFSEMGDTGDMLSSASISVSSGDREVCVTTDALRSCADVLLRLRDPDKPTSGGGGVFIGVPNRTEGFARSGEADAPYIACI